MANQPAIEELWARYTACCQAGDFFAAEAACAALLSLVPEDAEAWLQLGLVRLQLGRLPKAEAAFRESARLAPSAGVWHNLSVAMREQGRYTEAEAAARQALALDRTSAAIWLNLANALYCQSRWEEAAAGYRESLALDPQNAHAWSNLAAALQMQGRWSAAAAACERSLALEPHDLAAQLNYAQLLTPAGEPRRASELLETLVARQPEYAAAWVALAASQQAAGNLPRAAAAYLQALRRSEGDSVAQQNLNLLLSSEQALPLLEDALRQWLGENPLDSHAWSQLGVFRLYQARHEESLAALRRSIEIEPSSARHSRLLFALQNTAGISPEALLAEHRAWAAQHCPALPSPAPPRRRERRRLRLGFVSGDFGRHPVGFMVLPLLEQLDKSQAWVACYEDRPTNDEYNARFRQAADLWRITAQVNNDALAQQLRADEIDVAIDLGGHMGARLPALALRPAPLQVTWFGYVGTTGLPAIDCLLADRFHVPPGDEPHYVERVLRLPQGYACYGPPPDAPPVAPLPALTAGHVTFGCFNSPIKFAAPVFDAWAEILRRVPSSRLFLKSNGLGQRSLQTDFRERFARRGIAPDRILIEGWSPQPELLQCYGRVDLALDTQPYSGGLTTCEALWMGVPVVTFPGRTFAGRHSLSYLASAGLPQFVAADPAGYVELAVAWADRLPELAALRATLREQVRASPVCDAATFARDWLALIRQAYDARVGIV